MAEPRMPREARHGLVRCEATGVLSPPDWQPARIEWRLCARCRHYEVSEYGHVRRSAPGKGTWAGRLLRTKRHYFGYRRVSLTIGGKRVTFEVHVLVAEAFIGLRPSPDHEVAHNDGNPEHNNYRNLLWKLHAHNEADKKRHGTATVGERNGQAKLSAESVRRIRANYPEKTLIEIGNELGVSFQTVSKIIHRMRWGHIE